MAKKKTTTKLKATTVFGYLQKVPAPVMAIDKDFNVLYMNDAGAKAVGNTPEACVGQKCFNLFKTQHCNTPNCQLSKAMETDTVCTGDTVARLPGGDLAIRYTGTALKDAKGNIIGGLEYVTDITKEIEVTAGIDELAKEALEGNLVIRAKLENY